MLELLSQKSLTKNEVFNSTNWEYLHAIQVKTPKVFLIAWHSSLIAFLVKASYPIPMAKLTDVMFPHKLGLSGILAAINRDELQL